MKDNVKLITEVGQDPRTWDIFDLLKTGNWGNTLRSTFQSTATNWFLVFSLIFLIKFLLFCISKQMPSSQMYIRFPFQRLSLKLT